MAHSCWKAYHLSSLRMLQEIFILKWGMKTNCKRFFPHLPRLKTQATVTIKQYFLGLGSGGSKGPVLVRRPEFCPQSLLPHGDGVDDTH